MKIPPVGSCIAQNSAIGKVQITIGLLNEDRTYYDLEQDAMRDPGHWLSSAARLGTVIDTLKDETSVWKNKRFGAKWRCIG